MLAFLRGLIRLITGRVAYERRAAFTAIEHAARYEWLATYGDVKTAALSIHTFLLTGEFPR